VFLVDKIVILSYTDKELGISMVVQSYYSLYSHFIQFSSPNE